MRAGLRYGLIGGVLTLIFDVLSITHLPSGSLGVLRGLVGFLLLILGIYYVLIFVFAGRVAAMQTGKVSTGALAGLVACVVATLTALPGVLVLYVVAPTMATTTFYLIPAATFGGMSGGVVAVIEHAISVGLSLALCVVLGVLGGLAGRRAYRRILSGYETPSRRQVMTERTVLLGLALFLLVVGMCLLSTMSGQ